MYFFIMSTTEEVRKAHNCRKYAIDGPADWLNRIFMPTLMIIFCFINLSQMWSQDDANISCVGFKDYKDFAEEYCWTQGIYTNRLAYHLPEGAVPYPGVVPCVGVLDPRSGGTRFKCSAAGKEEDHVYHLWYQWVPFYYTLVAVGYYLPYLLLKSTKLHHVKPMIKELLDPVIVETHHSQLISRLSTWMFSELVYPRYCKLSRVLMFWYDYGLVFTVVLVKALYLTVSVSHMWLTAQMFHIGDWAHYGLDFLKPPGRHETHTKDVLFPKMVACQVVTWGPTGKESTTGMCTLVNNVLNQYLFLIMWFMNVLLILVNITSTLFFLFKFSHPNTVHRSIVRASMMDNTQDFGRMFGYVGPSGRILLSKMAEHLPGFIMERIAKKVLVMVDKEQKKHKGKMPKINFTRVKGQNSEIARQPLMEISTLAFGIMPMAPGSEPPKKTA